MGHYKIGLIIPHPADQKWDSVWKLFRTPNLNLPTLAALIPEDEWDIEIQDEIVGPLDFTRDFDLVFITVTTQINCAEKLVRTLAATDFYGHMGTGEVIGGGGHTSESHWVAIEPGTLNQGLWEAACRNG
jgi:hypothetical protein